MEVVNKRIEYLEKEVEQIKRELEKVDTKIDKTEKDNKVGYRLITYSSSTVARLKETISIQYQDEAKTMSEEEFIDRVIETVRSIVNGEYSAWMLS